MRESRYISVFCQVLFSPLAVVVIILMLIGGCATGQSPIKPVIGAPSLPSYVVGTTFIYSDGSWETVTASSPDTVSWVDNRGKTSTGSPDFTRRRMNWVSKTRSGERQFGERDDIYTKQLMTLWPLMQGNVASFSEQGMWIDSENEEHAYRSNWVCRVTGTEAVSVMAGDFETWEIVCDRFSAPRPGAKAQQREKKTWYYAPAVGHYVMVSSSYSYDQRPRRKELLAVLPPTESLPAEAKHNFDLSFQQALEFEFRNQAVNWTVAGKRVNGSTTPTDTFQLRDGTYCRRYVQELVMADSRHVYYGIACRIADGKWAVPRK